MKEIPACCEGCYCAGNCASKSCEFYVANLIAETVDDTGFVSFSEESGVFLCDETPLSVIEMGEEIKSFEKKQKRLREDEFRIRKNVALLERVSGPNIVGMKRRVPELRFSPSMISQISEAVLD